MVAEYNFTKYIELENLKHLTNNFKININLNKRIHYLDFIYYEIQNVLLIKNKLKVDFKITEDPDLNTFKNLLDKTNLCITLTPIYDVVYNFSTNIYKYVEITAINISIKSTNKRYKIKK